MATKLLKVYLDHHVKRENLLYRRLGSSLTNDGGLFQDFETSQRESIPNGFPYLLLKHLYGDESLTPYLRKPDFQRSTWAWSSVECVDLLETVYSEYAVLCQAIMSNILQWQDEKERKGCEKR